MSYHDEPDDDYEDGDLECCEHGVGFDEYCEECDEYDGDSL